MIIFTVSPFQKRPSFEDVSMEIPEDLSLHRDGTNEGSTKSDEKSAEVTAKKNEIAHLLEPSKTEKRLAYFLVQEMLPSEIIEGEGFKVSSFDLILDLYFY